MKLWFVTDDRTLLNGDRVRMLYEKAGVDDPEDQGVFAVLDFEWKPGHRRVRLQHSSLIELAKWIGEQDGHLIIGHATALDPVDV